MPRKNIPQSTSQIHVSTAPALRGKSVIIQKLNVLLDPLRARNERHYRDSQFHLWADIILAAILVGAAVLLVWLLVWQPKPAFSLETRLPSSRILSGQTEEFIISYKNQEDQAVSGAVLSVELPANFALESATPTALFDPRANTFLLGDLKKGEQGDLRIIGTVRGSVGDSQTLGLNLFYQYKQVKKQVLNSLAFRIDGSALELSLDVPDKAFQNIPVNGSVEVKNAGRSKIENAVLAFSETNWEIRPENASLENGHLRLMTLEPGETKRYNFSALTKEASGSLPISVEAQLVSGESVFKQAQINRVIAIVEPGLTLKTDWQDTVFGGQSGTLNLNFKNNEQVEITELAFNFESARATSVISKLSSSAKNINLTNNIARYTQALKVGAEDNLAIEIFIDRRTISLNDSLALKISVSYMINGEPYSYVMTTPSLKVNSNLSVSSGGYYYSAQGDQLGVGPIPPKVDIPTTYWIIWEANNLGNDIANFEVSADLPGNLVWLDQQSVVAGTISYSPVTRRILWQVDALAKSGGNYRANFAISLVPRAEDLGTVPVLLSNISFLGKDQYTGATISKKLSNITTNIETDRHAAGKGKVEALE